MSSARWGLAGLGCVGWLCGCGLDVTFEERNRARLEAYDPNHDEDALGEQDAGAQDDAGPTLERFGHAAWAGVLRGFLSGACVDYEGLGASDEGLALLDSYLDALARADLEGAGWDEQERAAFWINAYNALTVAGVVEERLRDPDFAVDQDAFVFFQTRKWEVGGLLLSLDLIEHGILRGDTAHASWLALDDEGLKEALEAEHGRLGGDFDARIHAALNCASRSCPDLALEPFEGGGLDAQLEARTRRFLADAGKGAGPDGVSSLFMWFEGDFEASAGSVGAFIEQHREGGAGGVRLDAYLPYSWEPNEQDEGLAACMSEAQTRGAE